MFNIYLISKTNEILLIFLLLIILTIIIKIVISGIKYANSKILKCNECGKKQPVWFMLKSNNPNRIIKTKCMHCGEVVTFTIQDNLKNVTDPSGWKLKVMSTNGETTLFGVKIFKEKWHDTEETLKVYDPLYNGEHVFPIYKVILKNKEYLFSFGEFSNGFGAFYVNE